VSSLFCCLSPEKSSKAQSQIAPFELVPEISKASTRASRPLQAPHHEIYITFIHNKDVWRTALVSFPLSASFKSNFRNREQDKEATVYIGNIDERVTDSLVWELMLQAGRIVNVHLPKDRVTQTHQGYGFVEFISEEDAEYAARIMNQVRLYGKPIRVNKVHSFLYSRSFIEESAKTLF
jgi:hypothetical protein